jgi:hypothetical protein
MPIYFIQAETGEVKIGYTGADPETRLQTIQGNSPCKLTLLAAIKGSREKELLIHAQFKKHRLHGEWFAPVPSLLEFMKFESKISGWVKRDAVKKEGKEYTERITVKVTAEEKADLEREAAEKGVGVGTWVRMILIERRAGMVAEATTPEWTVNPGILAEIDERARSAFGGSHGQMKIARVKAVRAMSLDYNVPGDIKAAKAYVEANYTQCGNGRARLQGDKYDLDVAPPGYTPGPRPLGPGCGRLDCDMRSCPPTCPNFPQEGGE